MTDTNKEREAAEQWLRDRYGAYRGHFAWRELEEAFLAGRASLAASAGSEPVAWFVEEHSDVQDLEWNRLKPTYPGNWKPLYTHPSPPEGAGWKLVPIEPTEEMLAAAHDGDREYTLRNFGDVMTVMQGPYDHWAAMIAAAPPASEAKGA